MLNAKLILVFAQTCLKFLSKSSDAALSLFAFYVALLFCDVDALEELDIGIQAIASIPVGADSNSVGEVEIPVNFGGVTFLPGDHIYADNTGVILSPEPLDID